MKAEMRKTIEYWAAFAKKPVDILIERKSYYREVNAKNILAYIGVRRCGKTVIAVTCGGNMEERMFYMNFEDPFFVTHDDVDVLEKLVDMFVEIYGREPGLLVFDEIHNISNWERWARKTVESRRYKMILTGSSSQMLASDVSTALTGRCLKQTVWPLSFKESLDLFPEKAATEYECLARLKAYLKWGGFPAVALEPDEKTKREILLNYLQDIVYKDIVRKHQIRNVHSLNQIVQYYFANISCPHSFTKVKNAFSLNLETVQEYSAALNAAFLFFYVNRYHPNLKVQARDPRKLYAVDTGLRNANTFSASADIGRLAENAVYVELRRRGGEMYYYSENGEVDFITVEGNAPTGAIQVCYDNMEAETTYKREVGGLIGCLKALKLREGLILTENRQETLREGGLTIKFVPLFKWLLE